jgi:hypothetical protein
MVKMRAPFRQQQRWKGFNVFSLCNSSGINPPEARRAAGVAGTPKTDKERNDFIPTIGY